MQFKGAIALERVRELIREKAFEGLYLSYYYRKETYEAHGVRVNLVQVRGRDQPRMLRICAPRFIISKPKLSPQRTINREIELTIILDDEFCLGEYKMGYSFFREKDGKTIRYTLKHEKIMGR